VVLRISRAHWQALLVELEEARSQRHLVTYRSLIERLQLPAPAMATLTAALEHLIMLDVQQNLPLRSALVVSQSASRMPRPGFFECAQRFGRFSGQVDSPAAAAWHASEVTRVFEYDFSYPT
jgi:hypothetical protein